MSPLAPDDERTPAAELPKIVAFGGGTGMAALLQGVKHYTDRITAVVTVTDNGGSSGRLRNDFDIAAPGDIRNCLLALAELDPIWIEALQYRFSEAEFKGHCFGNLLITVLARVLGDFKSAVLELNRLLRVRGRVIPAAVEKVSLVACHPDGSKSTGEVQVSRSGKPIQRVELRPWPVRPSPEILEAVEEADLFLFGPGSLYTSVIPNLLLEGLADRIRATGKPRVYIANIMTQPGETSGYALSDHIRALRDHVGPDFPDVVIAHSGTIPEPVLSKYRAAGAEPVACDIEGKEEFQGIRLYTGDFFREEEIEGQRRGKPGAVRHNSEELARVIYECLLRPLNTGEAAAGAAPPAGGRNREVSAPKVFGAATGGHGTRTAR